MTKTVKKHKKKLEKAAKRKKSKTNTNGNFFRTPIPQSLINSRVERLGTMERLQRNTGKLR